MNKYIVWANSANFRDEIVKFDGSDLGCLFDINRSTAVYVVLTPLTVKQLDELDNVIKLAAI